MDAKPLISFLEVDGAGEVALGAGLLDDVLARAAPKPFMRVMQPEPLRGRRWRECVGDASEIPSHSKSTWQPDPMLRRGACAQLLSLLTPLAHALEHYKDDAAESLLEGPSEKWLMSNLSSSRDLTTIDRETATSILNFRSHWSRYVVEFVGSRSEFLKFVIGFSTFKRGISATRNPLLK